MNGSFFYASPTRWDRWITVLFVSGLVSLTGCQSLPLNSKVQNLDVLPRTLTVSGKGDVSIPTTLTQVHLGVEVQGKTAQDVQQEVAKRSQAVVQLLKSRNVQKLETTGINLNPNYTNQEGKASINSYRGTNIVRFQIDTNQSGSLLDEAIKAGATRIDQINFIATDEAIATAQQQAIQKAIQQATQQADAALKSLDLSQREILGIQINPTIPPQPLSYTTSQPALDQSVSKLSNTPIIGGKQNVVQFVTLQIRY